MHEIGGVPGAELFSRLARWRSTVRGLMRSVRQTSTNEELETSKEELQSVNEELHTVNTELNSKIDELDRANTDLRNLFESTQIATVLLDGDLIIRSFTPAVTTIFNLISADRSRPLTDIVSHFETDDLRRDIRTVLECGQTMERSVVPSDKSAQYLIASCLIAVGIM